MSNLRLLGCVLLLYFGGVVVLVVLVVVLVLVTGGKQSQLLVSTLDFGLEFDKIQNWFWFEWD